MSRSRRKTPIVGNCSTSSEKFDKKILHGKMRTSERNRLSRLDDSIDDLNFLIDDELMTTWDMQKDGKGYMPKNSRFREKDMRK